MHIRRRAKHGWDLTSPHSNRAILPLAGHAPPLISANLHDLSFSLSSLSHLHLVFLALLPRLCHVVRADVWKCISSKGQKGSVARAGKTASMGLKAQTRGRDARASGLVPVFDMLNSRYVSRVMSLVGVSLSHTTIYVSSYYYTCVFILLYCFPLVLSVCIAHSSSLSSSAKKVVAQGRIQ